MKAIGIIVSLFTGAAIGAGVTYFLEERKYKKILECNDSIIDGLEAARQKFIEERKESEVPFEVDDNGDDSEDVHYDLKEIKEKLKNGKARVTDYTNMYSASDMVDNKNDDEEDDPEDEEAEAEEEEEERTAANIFNELQKSTRAPKIVKSEEVDEHHEGWDIDSLFLYSNGILTDEDDNIIDGEEKDKLVGDCLTKYDFIHSNERMIYIKNFKLNTFYEVTKFDKPFDE